MQNQIIVQPSGGLCNRMRTIVSAVTLAEKMGCSVSVIWTRDITLNCSFNDLFSDFPIQVKEFRLASLPQRLYWFYLTRIKGYSVITDSWIVENARDKAENTFLSKLQGKNLLIYACQDIIRYGDYGIFQVNKQLEQSLLPDVDQRCIGIHIRRSDNDLSIKESPTILFEKKIEEELLSNPYAKFYLATDDLREELHLKEKYGDRIITFQKHSYDRNDPMAIKEALTDLRHLSKCKKLYGSYMSSFSDVASFWGGIEKETLRYAEA